MIKRKVLYYVKEDICNYFTVDKCQPESSLFKANTKIIRKKAKKNGQRKDTKQDKIMVPISLSINNPTKYFDAIEKSFLIKKKIHRGKK